MTTIDDLVKYRIVIVQQDSRSVLALSTAVGHRLPCVEISTWARPARQLRTAVRVSWGVEILILDLFSAQADSTGYIVAELLIPSASPHLKAVPLNQLSGSEWSEEERARTAALLLGQTSSPFSRIGWLDEAAQWLKNVTQLKLLPKCAIEQYNAGGAFSLIRFLTEDGLSYWFKATGEPNAHECPVTCLLSKMCGAYLPAVIALKPEWNAWVMSGETTAISTVPSGPFDLFHFLEEAVESMAALQIMTMGRKQAMLEAGAFDQGLDHICEQSEALFASLEEAMSLQTSTKVPRIEKVRLRELREILNRVCDRVDSLSISESIVHGDMNLGNILRARTHCQFIDWSEAYVGCPLITLQHLLLFNASEDPQVDGINDRALKNRYRTAFLKVCDAESLDKAFAYMPLLAAASALYGRGQWFNTSLPDNPHRQSHARTLARYMDRAADDPALQAALRI